MKLTELLCEGLIKLPAEMLAEMRAFIVGRYLSFYQAWIEEELEGAEYAAAVKLREQAQRRYGVAAPSDDMVAAAERAAFVRQGFKVDPTKLPERYVRPLIQRNERHALNGLRGEVQVTLHLRDSATKMRGRYSPATRNLDLWAHTHQLTAVNLKGGPQARERALTRSLEQLLGTLEHELTHAVQDLLLTKFHVGQARGSRDSDDRLNYLNATVEFDPWIKSEVSRFKSITKSMRKLDDRYDEDAALRFFTAADGGDALSQTALSKLGFNKRSEFFLALKKVSPAKWRKAIKLFTQAVKS